MGFMPRDGEQRAGRGTGARAAARREGGREAFLDAREKLPDGDGGASVRAGAEAGERFSVPPCRVEPATFESLMR